MLVRMLDRKSGVPLYEQIYRHVLDEIGRGALPAGARMPSRRELSARLGCSPVTVDAAYAQLVAEGYLQARERSGHFVLSTGFPAPARRSATVVAEVPFAVPRYDLGTAAFDADLFPYAVWTRIVRETLREPKSELLNAGHPQGSRALREAIAEHLAAQRGFSPDPADIVVGAGSEYLIGQLVELIGREPLYAVEDPGYPKIARIVASHGARPVGIPLDGAGLDVTALRTSGADIVHVTPSHQFPTGVVMPVGRRRELLAWAQDGDRLILEDDYDSEFRFAGQPIPALAGLDGGDRVVYLNSFTKSLAPALRIAYMVLPPRLLSTYRERLGHYSCTVSNIEQETLSRFMAEGHFERHLARVRKTCRDRRDRFLDRLLASPIGNRLSVRSEDAGLHFVLSVDLGRSEADLVAAAERHGVRLAGLSRFGPPPSFEPVPRVVVGYAGLAGADVEGAVDALVRSWSE
ncbi:MAG: PLP-dependent aminotransferase family protein [Candidatus Izemoplasmatales bacterium]